MSHIPAISNASLARIAPCHLRTLHEQLGAEDARRAKLLAAALERFEVAQDKAACAAALRLELEPLGIRGLSVASLYRNLKKLRDNDGDIMAIVDGRLLRREVAGLAANKEFLDYWHVMVTDNRRKTAPAYRALFARLQSGQHIPGIGTWRDVWAREHDGIQPPAGMQCPYRPYAHTPQGWSIDHLRRLAPDKYVLAAARVGRMAATLAYIPSVPRTRVGLQCCQVVQIDDMWHEVKVAWEGNRKAQRCVQFTMLDILTGHDIAWFIKPVREREDGTRETLRTEWIRYQIAHLVCTVGIPEAGCLIMGERGTATIGTELQQTLADISGGRIRFSTGGLLSTPLAKGLYSGDPRGNPRSKGFLEGFQGLLKNELGNVAGHIGGGRGKQPEDAYGLDQADNRLRRIAAALEDERPGILSRLAMPYKSLHDYSLLVNRAFEALNNRTWHQMEGWEKCGFVTGEYRTPDGHWLPLSGLDIMPANQAAAWRNLIDTGAIEYHTRRMSPAEAWAVRAHERQPLGDWAAPLIMGDSLARHCKCSDRLELTYKDPDTLRTHTVAGILAGGGGSLERGATYRVWINPLDSTRAYIADHTGRYLGVAPVAIPGMYGDAAAAERNLGIRSSAIAEANRRLAPVAAARQRRADAAARRNVIEIAGSDPVHDRALQEAVTIDAPAADLYDLAPPTLPPASAPALADFL